MSAAILIVLLTASAAPQHWKFNTGTSPQVSVSNVDGSISVRAVPGSEVSVEATVSGDEGNGWTVDVKQDGSEVHARACCGTCDTHLGGNCRSGKVQFVLSVPPDTKLEVRGVSSNVTVEGLSGAQSIHTVSGRIEDRGSAAPLDVHSVSGAVTLTPKTIAQTQVQTISGDVHLKLPPNADAKVQLSTVSGKLNGKSVGIGKFTDASFGKGTVAMNIHTVSGSVEAQPGE